MNPKIDGAFIQDIWHYALAMQGNGESTFPCDTILDRLEAAKIIHEAIDCLSVAYNDDLTLWNEVQPQYKTFCTLEYMERAGRLVQRQAEAEAKKLKINPRTGDKRGYE